MDKISINEIEEVKKMLDKSEVMSGDRIILVPGELNRKTYKGYGRPRNDDYIIRSDFRKILQTK